LAIANRRKINSLATMIAPYPTYGEASKRAAGNFFTGKLFSPRTQKLVRLPAEILTSSQRIDLILSNFGKTASKSADFLRQSCTKICPAWRDVAKPA
jgi:hypothetical protein